MSFGRIQSHAPRSGRGHILGLPLFAAFSAGLLLSSCGAPELGPEDEQSSSDRALEAQSRIPNLPHKALCERSTKPGVRHCHARIRTDMNGIVPFAAGPSGLNPADLRAAYSIPASGGNGKIVAIIDAMDDPNAEADLGKYRSQFGLPACTTANGCFKNLNGD